MAWTCHATDNQELVNKLTGAGLLKTDAIICAFRAVDRGLFVPDRSRAYTDAPQVIGWGATISAPHMHATCLELFKKQLKPGCKVLDVGSGSGYLTLVFSWLAQTGDQTGQGAKVIGVEHMPQLVQLSQSNAAHIPWAVERMQAGTLQLIQGDGYAGCADRGPFDIIHVGAAAPQVPESLVASLAPGGRMVIPVGPEEGPQYLMVIDRTPDGQIKEHNAGGVMYVPLTSQDHQLRRAGAR